MRQALEKLAEWMAEEREKLVAASLLHHKAGEDYQAGLCADRASALRKAKKHVLAAIKELS